MKPDLPQIYTDQHRSDKTALDYASVESVFICPTALSESLALARIEDVPFTQNPEG
jgi:hypothetical protein